MSSNPAEILLVEDDQADQELTRIALRQARIYNELRVIGDGETALAYLRGEGEHAQRPRPDLVLLDINLPRVGGLDVLEAVKRDEDLRTIPVVMLSGSRAGEDIDAAYRHYANSYIVKPVEFSELHRVLASLTDFWFTIVRLPSDASSGRS